MSPPSKTPFHRRTIIWSDSADAELALLARGNHDRLDDVMRGIERSLEYPDKGAIKAKKKSIFARTTNPIGGAPAIILFYAYNDEQVEVLGVRISAVE